LLVGKSVKNRNQKKKQYTSNYYEIYKKLKMKTLRLYMRLMEELS
jgi:hypothetical protein